MSKIPSISTHILNIAEGKPAAKVPVTLEFLEKDFIMVAQGVTNEDGRVGNWLSELKTGTYRIRFEIKQYFADRDEKCFYPYVEIVFIVTDTHSHYHVPLLLSPYGYSTYRGS